MTTSNPRDLQIDSDASDLPWVPQAEGVWFKPLRLCPAGRSWANLLRFAPSGVLGRHRHHGEVHSFTFQGTWRYLEHDWVARPGSYVYEPVGDVHTLVIEGQQEMIGLFVVEGHVEYLDDQDRVILVDTPERKLARYQEHCRKNGLPMRDLVG